MNRKSVGPASERLVFFVGLLLLSVGFVANEWIVRFISPDDVLATSTRIQVWAFDIFFVFLGVNFIRFRRRKAFYRWSLLFLVSISLIFCLEIIFQRPVVDHLNLLMYQLSDAGCRLSEFLAFASSRRFVAPSSGSQ